MCSTGGLELCSVYKLDEYSKYRAMATPSSSIYALNTASKNIFLTMTKTLNHIGYLESKKSAYLIPYYQLRVEELSSIHKAIEGIIIKKGGRPPIIQLMNILLNNENKSFNQKIDLLNKSKAKQISSLLEKFIELPNAMDAALSLLYLLFLNEEIPPKGKFNSSLNDLIDNLVSTRISNNSILLIEVLMLGDSPFINRLSSKHKIRFLSFVDLGLQKIPFDKWEHKEEVIIAYLKFSTNSSMKDSQDKKTKKIGKVVSQINQAKPLAKVYFNPFYDLLMLLPSLTSTDFSEIFNLDFPFDKIPVIFNEQRKVYHEELSKKTSSMFHGNKFSKLSTDIFVCLHTNSQNKKFILTLDRTTNTLSWSYRLPDDQLCQLEFDDEAVTSFINQIK